MIQAIFDQMFNNEEKTTKVSGFSVVLDSATKAKNLVKYIDKYGLSTDRKVIVLEEGLTSLSFFFNNKYDVEAIDSPIENIVRELEPRYFLSESFWTVVDLIKNASEEKKVLRKELKVKNKSLLELRNLKKESDDYKNMMDILTASLTAAVRPVYAERVPNRREECVYISDHYIQQGSEIYFKDPNDLVKVTCSC